MGLFDFFRSREEKTGRLVTKMVYKMAGMAIDGAKLDKARMPINENSGRLVGYISGLCKTFYEIMTDEPAGRRATEACTACIHRLFPQRSEEMINLLNAEPTVPSILDGFMIALEDGKQFVQQLPMVGIHRILLEDYLDFLGAPDMPEAMLKIAELQAKKGTLSRN